MPPSRRPTGIDLFCGVGGMSLGFEQAGFDVRAAFDVDAINVETYARNFPSGHVIQQDLTRASGRELLRQANLSQGQLDVLFGGPPCQGFSVGGRRVTDDPRNRLLGDFARLVAVMRPKYFVLENVQGLLYKHAAHALALFLGVIADAGYSVVTPITALNAADFGVPQRRHRTFVLGYKRSLAPPAYPKRRGLVDKNGREYFPCVSDALRDLFHLDRVKYLWDWDVYFGPLGRPSSYAQLMRASPRDPDCKNRRSPTPVRGLTGCIRTHHASDSIRRFASTRPGSVEQISRYLRLDPNGVAPTIRAGTGPDRGSHTAPRPIHPKVPRCITVREAARLHSFPDWFQFHETRWHAFRQIGNSVPPLMALRIAEAVISRLIS